MPGCHGSDAEYDAHAHASGRWHAHAAEYHTRRAQYHASKRAIAEHNGQTKRTYDQALNHFADWSAEEWRALVHVRVALQGSVSCSLEPDACKALQVAPPGTH